MAKRLSTADKVVNGLTLTAWVVAFAGLVSFGFAKPEEKSFFDDFMGVHRGAPRWSGGLIRTALALTGLSVVLGLASLFTSAGTNARIQPAAGVVVLLSGVGVLVLLQY